MTVEIYFSNLNEEKQKEVLKEFGVENASEMNWDTFPLTTVESEKA